MNDSAFQNKVNRNIRLFLEFSHRELERQVAHKRVTWLDREFGDKIHLMPRTPRGAYELFFFNYLKISREEVPIVSESDDEIVWRSWNRCSTLEACQAMALDTRILCRSVFEKSTQAVVSRLDPRLRFHRNYRDIRPYADYCEERIVRIDFDHVMDLAIQEAEKSRSEGNKGYGAVLMFADEVIAQAHDTAATEGDPSQHAEVNVIRQAVQTMGDTDLCGCVLFSTCEPCPMCVSLAVWANVTTIVYGASIEETVRLGKSRIRVGAKEIVEKSPGWFEVIGGIQKERCLDLYR